MRSTIRDNVKGVATMKFLVAVFLVLAMFSSGAVTLGQNPPQRTTQNSAPKPQNDTIRICQGVPLPDGYVIVAYMTSAACPTGAYLLKKQEQYEASLAINDGGRPTAAERDTASGVNKPVVSSQTRTNSWQPRTNSSQSMRANSQTKANQAAGTAQPIANGASAGLTIRP